MPPLVGQYVLLVKDSSVVSAIGVVDITRVGWLTVQRIPEGHNGIRPCGPFIFRYLLSANQFVEFPGKADDCSKYKAIKRNRKR